MRYIQPTITGTFDAVATIKGNKIGTSTETQTTQPSLVAAYAADE